MDTIAFKFVNWDIPELESLKGCKVYNLRIKVLNNEKLTREEKNWITNEINHNSYFRTAISLHLYYFSIYSIWVNIMRIKNILPKKIF